MPAVSDARSIGLDLDNTIIDYAESYRGLASRFGLPSNVVSREAIRSRLSATVYGDEEWQRFQSVLYSEGVEAAKPAPGLIDLLETCRQRGFSVMIISHKTHVGPERFGARDLRSPARAWLRRYGISPGFIPEECVRFHATAREKVNDIAKSLPSWFVDDLEKILSMENFPGGVKRVLYRAGSPWVEREDGVALSDFSALSSQVIL